MMTLRDVTVLLSVYLSCLVLRASCFSTDPELGRSACLYLYPSGHEAEPQTTKSFYKLAVNDDEYEPGLLYIVTLTSSPMDIPFRGFIIQARLVDQPEVKVGEFTAKPGETKLNCISLGFGGKTITHYNSSMKVTQSMLWLAPDTYVGDIQFRATVVEAMATYWANITSPILRPASSPRADPDVTEDTSPATTPGSVAEPGSHQDQASSDEQLGDLIDPGQCGVTSSCYRSPDSCTDNCDFMLTWLPAGNVIKIQLGASIQDIEKYVSVGLSRDTLMGDDIVFDCIYLDRGESGDFRIQQSYNLPNTRENVVNGDTRSVMTNSSSGYYGNGRISCEFTLEPAIDDSLSLDEPYYLLLAKGPASGAVKGYHSEAKISSSVAYNLRSMEIVDVGGVTGYLLVKIHGILMILAWMVSASFAILMPRYFKKAWPGRTFHGKAIWFQVHQSLMLTTLSLTIIGFVIIFVHVGGYADYRELPSRSHPPLGIVTTALVIINPIMAAFRPSPTSKRRPFFNFFHFCVGLAAHALAVASMYIGVFMSKAAMPSWSVKIMGAYVVWHILIEISLAVDKHCFTSTASDPTSYNMNQPGEKGVEAEVDQVVEDSRNKTILAGLHLTGVLALALALIVPLAST